MRRVLACLCLMLAALAATMPAWAQPRPFELREGQVVITVTIKGRQLPALLDTGSERSLIETGLAKELGIRTQRFRRGGTMGAGGGRAPYGRTQTEVPLDFGAGAITRHLGTYEAGHSFAAEGVRLLIGMDLVGEMVLSLDFEKMTVDFARSATFVAPASEPFKMRWSGWHRIVLPVDLAGSRAELLLDTAATGSLHLDSDFVGKTPALKALPVSPRRIVGIDGAREHDSMIVPTVTLGGQVFTNVRASSVSLSSMHAADDMDGIVGVDLLKRFNVVIDFGYRRVWMTPHAPPDN